MNIKFTFPGEPVPAMRPKVTRNGTYTPAKYRNYKKALAKALQNMFHLITWDVPKAGTKERTQYLKSNRFELDVKIYRVSNRGDIDNFIKTVQDALQDASVIGDDAQIDKVSGEKFIDKKNPRVEFTLRLKK